MAYSFRIQLYYLSCLLLQDFLSPKRVDSGVLRRLFETRHKDADWISVRDSPERRRASVLMEFMAMAESLNPKYFPSARVHSHTPVFERFWKKAKNCPDLRNRLAHDYNTMNRDTMREFLDDLWALLKYLTNEGKRDLEVMMREWGGNRACLLAPVQYRKASLFRSLMHRVRG